MELKPWGEGGIAGAIDERAFCIQMGADTMKMDVTDKGESLEGEKRVKGRTLGHACIQDEKGAGQRSQKSCQSNNMRISRLSQKIKEERGSRRSGSHHGKCHTEVRG